MKNSSNSHHLTSSASISFLIDSNSKEINFIDSQTNDMSQYQNVNQQDFNFSLNFITRSKIKFL
jgi:hypothetical protein